MEQRGVMMKLDSFNRRHFLSTASMGSLGLYLTGKASARTKRPPNILLLVSDDQGYHDLGCYGNEEIITPYLDQLAKEGVRLTQFYVTWPACTPSRGSLLTGRYPQRNGTCDMFRNDKVDYGYKYPPEEYAISPEKILGMDVREILIPRILKQKGYVSGIFGKWDLGMQQRFLPLQRGFDEFYGYVNTGIDYYTHERYGVPSMFRNNNPTTEDKGTYTTYLFEREAIRFIRKNKDRPFFCYVPYNAPHIASVLEKPKPVQVPQKYVERYPKTNDAKKQQRIDHMACLTCMDESIGNIINTLKQEGIYDNTIVIFLSDNGGSGTADNTPLRGGKSRMFEGGLRVPCIVRWPDRIPKGTVCDEFLTTLEVLPTLCHAADCELPSNIIYDGFDMAPVLAGERKSKRNEMFWRRRSDKAARVGNWKWVDSSRGSGLFDLSTDLGEQNDLSSRNPEMLKKMKGRFTEWMKEMDAAEPRDPFQDY